MRTSAIMAALIGVVTVSAIEKDQRADAIHDGAMIGAWRGSANIVVDWTTQRTLAVAVLIREDGNVEGQIGDAKLVGGKLASNRGWIARRLNWKTDWIITGSLQGSLIEAEGVTRASVSIPLNWNGSEFVGGLHSSGSSFGGKKRMRLSARGLVLRPEIPAG